MRACCCLFVIWNISNSHQFLEKSLFSKNVSTNTDMVIVVKNNAHAGYMNTECRTTVLILYKEQKSFAQSKHKAKMLYKKHET